MICLSPGIRPGHSSRDDLADKSKTEEKMQQVIPLTTGRARLLNRTHLLLGLLVFLGAAGD